MVIKVIIIKNIFLKRSFKSKFEIIFFKINIKESFVR